MTVTRPPEPEPQPRPQPEPRREPGAASGDPREPLPGQPPDPLAPVPTVLAPVLTVLAARVVLAAVIIALVLAAAPPLVGWRSGVILNASMSPALHAGDLVVSGPADGAVRPGQLVSVDDPRRPGQQIVHRVVKVTGRGTVTTRGDANPLPDSSPVPPGAVRGVVRFSVPAVGLPVLWWQQDDAVALMAVAGVLLVLAWLATAPGTTGRRSVPGPAPPDLPGQPAA